MLESRRGISGLSLRVVVSGVWARICELVERLQDGFAGVAVLIAQPFDRRAIQVDGRFQNFFHALPRCTPRAIAIALV